MILDVLPPLLGDAAEPFGPPLVAFMCGPEYDREDSKVGSEITQGPLLDAVRFESDFIDVFAIRVLMPSKFPGVWINPHAGRLVS